VHRETDIRGREALQPEPTSQERRPWRLSIATHAATSLHKGGRERHLVFGGDCRARGDGEHFERYVVLPNV